jgi:hypothetical protein
MCGGWEEGVLFSSLSSTQCDGGNIFSDLYVSMSSVYKSVNVIDGCFLLGLVD